MQKIRNQKKISAMIIVIMLLQIIIPLGTIVKENLITLKSNAEHIENYYIGNASELLAFATRANSDNAFTVGTVYLTNDINLEGNSSNIWTPIKTFKGIFDGQGHTISGLYIDSTVNYGCFDRGLFARNNGTIKNINIENARILITDTENISDESKVGILTGSNYGIIQSVNIINSSINVITTKRIFIGGIAGKNSEVIENCNNSSNITTNLTNAVGGIVGTNDKIIRKSNNFGTIQGANETNYNAVGIGGVAGNNYNKINLCYNAGTVTGGNHVGGVVGTNLDSDDIIINCYNIRYSNRKYICRRDSKQ